MPNFVFVLDTNKRPLNPIHPGTARLWLNQGKAAVFRCYPFTIILKKSCPEISAQPITLKLDPGSKITGIALVQDNRVLFGAELQHRGQQIRDALLSRRQLRHSRRNRKTRYRQPRFLNRTRSPGWLAPSLQHRVNTVMTWVKRFCLIAPINNLSQELVRFNMQSIENPEISGIEYQQGELHGYEVREYLLEKWNRTCAYCGAKEVPLQVEHIHAKANGGTNRIANLTLACRPCNQKKSNQSIEQFLKEKPEVLRRIQAQAKSPLKDAAVVNSTRWALFGSLKAMALPVETGSGGKTKYNRIRLQLPKSHWLDAACVGNVETLKMLPEKPLLILAKGHGTRQMCGTNKYGFPIRHRSRSQVHKGFQTGDIVKAVVAKGKKIGIYVGRVLCRAIGNFDITTKFGRVSGINYKNCITIHRKDGYAYAY